MYKIVKNGVIIAKDFRSYRGAKEFADLRGWHSYKIEKQ